jgi:hypothetical protein
MIELKPIHTQIQKTIQVTIGAIVLEDPKDFPRSESNLYCLGMDGEMLWQAEKPVPEGLYNRVMFNADGETLSAYAVTGQSCELDLRTGKLISQAKIM